MTKLGISALVVLALVVGAGDLISQRPDISPKSLITNFEECAKAGYPIMESYPAQCRTAEGKLFVQVIENPEKIAGGYVAGHVTIGPNCPVERIDEPCTTPPEAYTSREAVVYSGDGTTVKERVHLNAQGNYKISLAPGNYFVQIVPAGIGPGEKKSVTIKSFETSTVNFDIDTGIR